MHNLQSLNSERPRLHCLFANTHALHETRVRNEHTAIGATRMIASMTVSVTTPPVILANCETFGTFSEEFL